MSLHNETTDTTRITSNNQLSDRTEIGGKPPKRSGFINKQGVLAYSSLSEPRSDFWFRFLKRAYDIFVSSVALVLLTPLFCCIAIAIKLESRGSVLFCQNRHGFDQKLFRMYKFRTMNCETLDASGVQQTLKDDPRVSRIGRFLRKTSFDELPQFLNILKGDMSVVGPRPHVPGMLAAGVLYEDFDNRYLARHGVRPGLTGLAQVRGWRGETTTAAAALGRLECDLEYICRQSIVLDIEITLHTFWKEFLGGSGY